MRSSRAEPRAGRWAWAVPLIALALVVLAVVSDPPALRALRNAVFDQFQRWHPRSYGDPPVRIVDIDEESLRRVGQWPWPRDKVAQLVRQLDKAQPASIALDVMFPERDRQPAFDAEFASVLSQGNVAIGFAMTAAGGTHRAVDDDGLTLKAGFFPLGGDPIPFLLARASGVSSLPEFQQAAAGQGAITFAPDVDGVIRKAPLLLNLDGRLVPSLAAEALRLAVGARHYTVRSAGDSGGVVDVRIGDHVIETDAAGALWVNYSRAEARRYVPAWQVLAGNVPADQLQGHIVFVGTSAQGLMDLRFGPLGGVIPGVEIHAQALEQVLTGQTLARPGWAPGLELVGTVLGALLVGVLGLRRSAWVCSCGFLALSAGAGASAWVAFLKGRVLIDPLVPVLGMALVFIPTTVMRYLQSERRQRWMKQTFSRYVSPNLVEYLITHPDALVLEGRRQRCSFVFADLAGFTRLMEKMDPGTAVTVVNGYLNRMIEIAFEHDGTLDRIVGDAVAIMFSAPIEQKDHEQRALRCALAMHAFSRQYVDDLAQRNIEFCHTRIGVHTGEVTVGNFGGDAIFDYRALGDPVNTAARLEGANKHLGTLICVSGATLAGCTEVRARPIGRLRLVGRSGHLMTYEPMADGTAAADLAYEQAYALMAEGRDEALPAFEALDAARPDDPLVRLHLSRLRAGERGDAIELSAK